MKGIERQLPEGEEVFLDHVGFFVPDMDEAAQALARLGFTFSEQNTHYNADGSGGLVPAGTVNRLVTFGGGYLEVLAASSDTPLADQLRESLARYRGLHLIAFGHADVAALEHRIRANRIDLQPTVSLRRPIRTSTGEATVGFTVLRAMPGAMAEGRVQFCEHLTPEHVWRPGRSEHANGADALTDLLIVAADAAETVDRYQRFTGRTARAVDGIAVLDLDRGRVWIADPEAAAAVLPGLRIPSLPYCAAVALRSSDLARTREALMAGGVPVVVDRENVVAVGPEDGLGAWIVFAGPDAEERPIFPFCRGADPRR